MRKEYPIVFICGLGGTGKSTFADKLKENFSIECKIIRLDWYLKYSTSDRKSRIKKAFESGDKILIKEEENPLNWNDFEKLKRDLLKLQQESRLEIKSVWNQQTGEKDLDIRIKLEQQRGLIICEGIYLLHPEIISVAKFVIFLKITEDEAIRRMKQRDSHRSSEEYLVFKAKLQKEYDMPYFKKYEHNADVIIKQIGNSYVGENRIQKIAKLIRDKLKLSFRN